MATAKWYVAHTYSGYENKVMTDIQKTVENRNMHDIIQDIRVPMEEVIEIKDNQKKVVERKIYPSYVMVKMIMTDESWYVVRNTRGVTGFVGPGSKPVPLSDDEMESLGFGKTEVALDYAVGDTIVVTAGAWKDTIGAVKSINESKHTLTINVEMFGRETPVELSFSEIKKM